MSLKVLLPALLLGAVSAWSTPILTNGSFETNSSCGPAPGGIATLAGGSTCITGWTVTGDSIDYIDNGFWQAANGALSLDLNGNATGGIQQVISGLIVGDLYRVTFDLAGNPLNGPTVKTLTVSAAGFSTPFTFDTTGHTTTSMGYVLDTFNFVASGSTATLLFASTTSGISGPALDNVSIADLGVAAPEPASAGLLLLGFGLGALGLRRRRVQ